MAFFRSLKLSAKRLFSGHSVQAEIDDEIAFHIDMETEKNIAAGLSRTEARRRALQDFGGKERIRYETRNAFGFQILANLFTDTRYAFRILAKRLTFTASALAVIAISIGANTAFFAAFESLSLKPLPFPHPERLVEIYREDRTNENAKLGGNLSLLGEYREQSDLFESAGYFTSRWVNLNIDGQSFRINAIKVSPDFFKTIGLPSASGTLINEHSSDRTAVLSHSLWQSTLASSPDLIGKTLTINGEAYTILGVAAPGLEKTTPDAQVFLNIDQATRSADRTDESLRAANEGTIWARLRPGVTLTEAATALSTLEQRFASRASEMYRNSNTLSNYPIVVNSVQKERSKWASSRLALLLAISFAVLLIGLTNVANLLLSQLNNRIQEYRTRSSLGASPTRLLQQVLTETFLLVALGSLLGSGLGALITQYLAAESSTLFGLSEPIRIGVATIGYVLLLVTASATGLGLLVGFKSLTASRRTNRLSSQKQSTDNKSSTRIHSLLFVGQTALTLTLLIALGLLGKSFYQIITQDLGFEDKNIVTARIHLPDSEFDDARREAFKEQLTQRLSSHPAINKAALSSTIPTYGYPERRVVFHDPALNELHTTSRAAVSYTSHEYLDTMGLSLLQGRDFTETDAFGWQTPILVDSRFAKKFFPNESPIGKRINIGRKPRNPSNWPTIIGVVESAKQESIDDAHPLPLVYYPLKEAWNNEFSVFINSKQAPQLTLETLRAAVAEIDSTLPLFRAGPLSDLMDESLAARQGILSLGIGLGFVALVLATIGTYGSVAFRISQRIRELAIRLAIGATEDQLIRQNLSFDINRTLAGIAAGLLLAFLSSKLLSQWLFEVTPLDSTVYLGVSLFLLLICVLSSYLPLRKNISNTKLRL